MFVATKPWELLVQDVLGLRYIKVLAPNKKKAYKRAHKLLLNETINWGAVILRCVQK